MAEFFTLIQPYQTLVAAAASILAAVVFGPAIGGRIAERYARTREIWIRRLNFTSDLHRLGLALFTAPDPLPGETFNNPSPERERLYKRCVAVYSRGRILYTDDLDEAVLNLLLRLPALPKPLASNLFSRIARVLEEKNRGTSAGAMSVYLSGFAKLGVEVIQHLELMARHENDPGMRELVVQTQEAFATIANACIRALRKRSIMRPRHWVKWLKMERFMRKERKRLLTRSSKPSASRGSHPPRDDARPNPS